MGQLDSVDVMILEMLQSDGRVPLTKLSASLHLPHTTLRDRLRRLEESGVITHYSAVIEPAQVGLPVSAFVMVTLDQQLETSQAVDALMDIEEVTETYLLTGDVDVLVRISARDVEHLRHILYQKFVNVPGLLRTNTMIILDSCLKRGRLPIATVLKPQ